MTKITENGKNDKTDFEAYIHFPHFEFTTLPNYNIYNVTLFFRCQNTLEKLAHLSGVREHSIHGNNMTLELTSPGDTPVTGLLTLKFKEGKLPPSSWLLNDAELNVESLDIGDLVQEAVRMNDPVFLVTQVKHRLYSHAPLRHEIEALRHRLAYCSKECIFLQAFFHLFLLCYRGYV